MTGAGAHHATSAELLTKPLRDGAQHVLEALAVLLARHDLRPTDENTPELAAALVAPYRLRPRG